MLNVKRLKTKAEAKKYLARAFRLDKNVPRNHELSGASLSEQIAKSQEDIDLASDLDFFVAHRNGSFVGYFGIEAKAYLFTFFLAPSFRDNATRTTFWTLINSKMPSEFVSVLYDCNIAGSKFLSERCQKKLALEIEGLPATTYFFENKLFYGGTVKCQSH